MHLTGQDNACQGSEPRHEEERDKKGDHENNSAWNTGIWRDRCERGILSKQGVVCEDYDYNVQNQKMDVGRP